jgi:hypothetical protein
MRYFKIQIQIYFFNVPTRMFPGFSQSWFLVLPSPRLSQSHNWNFWSQDCDKGPFRSPRINKLQNLQWLPFGVPGHGGKRGSKLSLTAWRDSNSTCRSTQQEVHSLSWLIKRWIHQVFYEIFIQKYSTWDQPPIWIVWGISCQGWIGFF